LTVHRARRRPTTWRTLLSAPVLLLLVAGVVTACQSADASASGGDTLRVGFISNTPTPAGPEGWAQHEGTLAKSLSSAGIGSVSWVPFKNGPDLSAALQGGSLDLAILGDTPGLTAKANGIDTRLVNQAAVGQDTWLFAKKGGPTTVAGLAGTTIATQVGSYMYRYLVALLDQQGLTDKVKITHVYTTAAVSALQSGGIAAYAAPAGQLTAAMSQAGFSVIDKASADHQDLLGTSVTVITGKALAAHPKLPKAWNDARAQAVEQITAKPDDYYAFAATATQTTADVVKLSLPVSAYSPDAFTDKGMSLLTATNQFLASHQLEKSAVDITAWKTG
jgi:sulfonate transport system substrate-binding protein